MALPHAVSTSGSGVALVTPAPRLTGTLAEPFANSANASAGVIAVPLGAPVLLRKPGMPLPAQRMLSSAWHADCTKSRSAWQSSGQKVAFARRHEYGAVIAPLTITTLCCKADCEYCTTWSKAAEQNEAANARFAIDSQSKQSLVGASVAVHESSTS